MKFLVEVITGSGSTDQREIEAKTAREAEEEVRRRGLYPVRVVESTGKSKETEEKQGLLDAFFPISAYDRLLFTRKLSTFLKAGLPLLPSLEILRDQAPKGPLRGRLTEITKGIQSGNPFAECLESYPRDFSTFYVAAIRAGETGGQLPEILERIADYLDAQRTRKRKAITAALYPSILFVAVIAVVALVSVKYIPLVENFLRTMRVPLPGLTKYVLEVNEWLKENFVILSIFPIVGFIVYFYVLMKNKPIRRAIHSYWLKVPIIGTFIRRGNFAWMFRTFGMLAFSGVPILQALKICSSVIRNDVIREEVERVRDEVAKGEPISKTMEKGGVFERFAVSMIDVGERSGELDVMMNRVADYYDQELDESYSRLERLAPAVMTIIMAFLVGTVVIALYLPILSVLDTLSTRKGL